jgi:hypothetical protein
VALIVVVHGAGQQIEGELTLHDRYFSALRPVAGGAIAAGLNGE